ncbi:putative cytochrome P450 6a14 [Haematobia irritans]|uniref:putative cytochrome P450 6a14 n=1 Tax=Haematobia irritans TaxID=7368 RepID=UPI003F4F94C4
MLTLIGTLVIATFGLVVYYLFNFYTYWKRHGVLQETPLPLLGNFKGVGSAYHVRDVYQRLYNKFKGKASFAGVYMFLRKTALILDLDLIKSVMIKDFTYFHDRGGFNNVENEPLTGHLLLLEGEQWRAMRTKLTPVFTSARMKYMFSTVVKVGDNFSHVMGESLQETPDQILEIKELCARFTTDVIGTCAFGIECNSLKDPNAEFRRRGRDLFLRPRHNGAVQLFMFTNASLAKKLKMKLVQEDLHEFFVSVVRQTVNYRLENNVKCNDFMDLLIEMKAQDEEKARASKGIDLSHGLTIEQMAAQTFVFFLAGFETSSTTMSFVLYELARHQDIQDKLRGEILSGLKQTQGELTYEGMNAMEYLEQVIAETLRLYPVLSILLRIANNDYPVPNTSKVIEKGTMTVIPVHAIHHDPQYYENPEEFKPSRFTHSVCEKRHPSSYLPFGDGPRNCIGLRFGKMQTKVGLITLLRSYRFECCSKTEIPLVMDKKNILTSPKNGVYLKVIPL